MSKSDIVAPSMTSALTAVAFELVFARAKHSKPFNSKHEGIAIIREEYLEAENEVFHGRDKWKLRNELIQTAAMCVRMLEDLNL